MKMYRTSRCPYSIAPVRTALLQQPLLLTLIRNIFQINARTELALRYNDISPLENHHCAVAFEILEEVKMLMLQ